MSCEYLRMRIVDAAPVTGKRIPDRDYLAALARALIGVSLIVSGGCSTPRRADPIVPVAPRMAAADLALIERFQAEFALQGGDRVAASERLATAAMLSDDPNASLSALRSALFAGRLVAAQALLARWRQLQPEAPALSAYAAAVALANGDSTGAHAAADTLGDSIDAQHRLAEALRWVGSLERVLPFVEARVLASVDLVVWVHWAAFARDRRAPEMAMRLADLAAERFPGDARAFSLRAALVRERNPAGAIADLERALTLDPASKSIRLSLAHALDSTGESARAAEVVSAIRPATDDSVAAEIGYAARAQTPAPLQDAYMHLRSLPPPRPERRLVLLGNVAELVGASEEAERWYRDIPPGEHYADARLRLAALRFAAGDATNALKLVVDLRSGGLLGRDLLVRSYVLEAEVRAKASDAGAAVAVFDAGLHMLPDDGELLYARALMLAEAGRFDDMERDLKRLIELDPSDADALNALGYTFVDRNLRLDEAAELLARAEKLSPQSPALLDSLGWLAYRRGDLDTALNKLRAAHAALDDPEVAAHLGEVLWRKGQADAARQVWNAARARDPDHRTLRATIERFLP